MLFLPYRKIYIRNKLNLFCYLFQISMYPELNEYISEVLKSVKTIILANQMERLSLLIMDSRLKAVEKLSFNKIYINSFKNKRYLINLFIINSVIYIVAWIAKWLYQGYNETMYVRRIIKNYVIHTYYIKE